MHTSGIVVLPVPGQYESCQAEVNALAGAEVAAGEPDGGRFIAILETDSVGGQEALLRKVQSLRTVAVAELVCHHFGADDASEDVDADSLS